MKNRKYSKHPTTMEDKILPFGNGLEKATEYSCREFLHIKWSVENIHRNRYKGATSATSEETGLSHLPLWDLGQVSDLWWSKCEPATFTGAGPGQQPQWEQAQSSSFCRTRPRPVTSVEVAQAKDIHGNKPKLATSTRADLSKQHLQDQAWMDDSARAGPSQ